MKLGGRDAARFLARPDPALAGALLFGADPMRVALKRAALVEALVGPDAAAEMRLTRIAGADLRRDPAALVDAVRATGFFPGPRAVLVEDAADAAAAVGARGARRLARPATPASSSPPAALGAGSALRKAFEAAPNAVAIGIYADPPGRDEIEAALAAAGLPRPDRETMAEIEALAQRARPRRLRAVPRQARALQARRPGAALAPPTSPPAPRRPPRPRSTRWSRSPPTATPPRLAAALSGARRPLGQPDRRSPSPPAATSAPCTPPPAPADGADAALARARPPVFGPRRARMAAQARALGAAELEKALALIIEADLALRSPRPLPGPALVERLLRPARDAEAPGRLTPPHR